MRAPVVRDEAFSKGVLLIAWTDIPEHEEADFNEWYNREHMRDRVLGLPGLRWGRRFCALEHRPKYLAIYEAEDSKTFESAAYLAMVREPDPQSRRFMSQFQDPMRTICRRTVRAGEGEGPYLAVIEVSPASGRDLELRSLLVRETLPALLVEPGMIGGFVLEKDEAALEASKKQHLRAADRELDWAIVVEAQAPGALLDACTKHVGAEELKAAGAAQVGQPILFQQLYRVCAP